MTEEADPGLTRVNGFVAGQVALVAEGGLAAVTLVRLVTVDLNHVLFQRLFLGELGVTSFAEVVTFCRRMLKKRNDYILEQSSIKLTTVECTHHSWRGNNLSASSWCHQKCRRQEINDRSPSDGDDHS